MMSLAPTVAIEPKRTSPDSLLGLWLVRQSPATRRAYLRDLELFAAWLKAESPVAVIAQLLAAGHACANQLAEEWIAHQVERGLAPSTTNRRLAAITSVMSMARSYGLVEWGIEIPSRRVRPYRDTRGPGLEGVRGMLAVAASQDGIKALRDVALLLLLFTLGLRREEVSSLNAHHFDRAGRRLAVLGKGRTEREWITVPESVGQALERYLDARAAADDEPLFLNLDRASKGQRLTGSGIYRTVRWLGKKAGLSGIMSPHRVRHSSITQALDLVDGDVRRVRHFSRHARIDTVVLYDDARADHAGQIAALLTDSLDLPQANENTHCQAHPDGVEEAAEIGVEQAP